MTNSLQHDAGFETSVTDHDLVVAALQRTVAQLEARVAQLEQPPAQWVPLKAAAHDTGVEYETARTWAERGLIEARREGKRWMINLTSLRARKERFAGQVSAAKPIINGQAS
jgi:hypothetical protein